MHEKRQKTWALQHCPTQPGAVPQWYEYDNSIGTSFFQNLLAFGTKSCLRMGQINYINTDNTINGSNCMKNSTRDSTNMVIPLGQCSVQGFVIFWSCNLGNLTAKLCLSVIIIVTNITCSKSCLKFFKVRLIQGGLQQFFVQKNPRGVPLILVKNEKID